jgi:hypothetical protein
LDSSFWFNSTTPSRHAFPGAPTVKHPQLKFQDSSASDCNFYATERILLNP